MSYRRIIDRTQTRLKQILATSHFEANLKRDQELLWRLRGQRWLPNFRQLKYIAKTYGPREILATKIAAAFILLALIVEGANLYLYHRVITPATGGEYVEAVVGSPSVINPLFAVGNSADADLSALIFSSLLKTDEQGKLVPDLAEKATLDDKGTTYTITLKKGVKWHDNEPLTAEDLLFTVQSIKDPNFKSPLFSAFRDVQINLVDEQTIRFTLSAPYAPFPTLLTFGILPEHIWQEIEPKNALLAELNLKPVGSGPYQFMSFSKDKKGAIHEYKLARFNDYYGPGPFAQNLTLKFFSEASEAASAVASGNADGFGSLPGAIPAAEVEKLGKSGRQKLSLALPQYTALFFNQARNGALAEKAVREALTLAIDKQIIVKAVYAESAQIVNGPLLSGMLDYDENLSAPPFDPERAAKILDDAGWKRTGSAKETELASDVDTATSTPDEQLQDVSEGGYARTKAVKKGNKSETVTLAVKLTVVQKEETMAIARAISDSWAKIGVKTELEPVEAVGIQKDIITPRQYQVLLFGQILGRDPDPYSFWHSSQIGPAGFNLSGYNNKEVDKLLVSARAEADENKRQALYQEFQKKLLADFPAIFLYGLRYNYILPNKIKGAALEKLSGPTDRLININKWYIKTKKRIKWPRLF